MSDQIVSEPEANSNDAVCCIKGCNNPVRNRSFCNSHYMQWRRYGHPLAKEIPHYRHLNRQSIPNRPKSDTQAYRAWQSMRKRCTSPSNAGYKNYGGRGIKVCDAWMNSFVAFLEDMGPAPEGMTLDRIDFDGHYEPSNCRWATTKEQNMNRRNTKLTPDLVRSIRMRVLNGEKKSEVAKDLGVDYNTISNIFTGKAWSWITTDPETTS